MLKSHKNKCQSMTTATTTQFGLFSIVLLSLLFSCLPSYIHCMSHDAEVNCRLTISRMVTVSPSSQHRITCLPFVDPFRRYYLYLSVSPDDSAQREPLVFKVTSPATSDVFFEKPIGSRTNVNRKLLVFSQKVPIEFVFDNTDTVHSRTFRFQVKMRKGVTQSLFFAMTLSVLPTLSIIGLMFLTICCMISCLAYSEKKKGRLQRKVEFVRDQQIRFKEYPSDEMEEVRMAESKYLLSLNRHQWLRHLPILPSLNILQFLEIRVGNHYPISVLHLTPKAALERMIVRQLYGGFVRNENSREVYMIFKYIDFSECRKVLQRVPYCTKLVDCKGIKIRHKDNRKNRYSYQPQLYTPSKLKRVHGLNTRHLTNEEVVQQSKNHLQKVSEVSLDYFDLRLLASIPPLKRLKIDDTLDIPDSNILLPLWSELEVLHVSNVPNSNLVSFLLRDLNLRELSIGKISRCQIQLSDWEDEEDGKVENLVLFKALLTSTIAIPIFRQNLKSVSLGYNISLVKESFVMGMQSSDPHQLVQSAEILDSPSGIHSLSVVENMPVEFFNPNVLKRFPNLKRLNISLSTDSVHLVPHLFQLKQLTVLQLNSRDVTIKNVIIPLTDHMLTQFERLEQLVLFNSVMYTKHKTPLLSANQDSFSITINTPEHSNINNNNAEGKSNQTYFEESEAPRIVEQGSFVWRRTCLNIKK